jgi:archaellum component FlaF (FlaF/FlaG flagellin family)
MRMSGDTDFIVDNKARCDLEQPESNANTITSRFTQKRKLEYSNSTSTEPQSEHLHNESEHSNVAGKGIGLDESMQVSRYRICVISIVIICAILVGVGVFYYARRYEIHKCNEQFDDDAKKVLHSVGTNVVETFAALDSFTTSIVSHAHATNASFPYVNIPDYGNRVSKLKSMETVLAIWTMILVKPEERIKYEEFAWRTKRLLVNSTLQIQKTDPGYHGVQASSVQFNYSIHGDYEPIPYNVT